MKVKLTAILENDKPAGDISEDTLKMMYQTFFNMLIIMGSEGKKDRDKATVISAEIMEGE